MSETDIERMLLARMTEQSQIQLVHDLGIRQEVFEDPYHRLMFGFMMDYWKTAQMKQPPTWIVMETEYPSIPLPPAEEVTETTAWMCQWLKKRYVVNQGQDILRRAAVALGEEQTKPDGDPAKVLNSMWQQAYDASQVVAPASIRSNMTENVQARRERYNRDVANREDLLGVGFGLAELDEHTQGLFPGELGAVAARTKVGKSWLLAKNFVETLRAGKRPVLFTLEMDIEEMEDRIDCLYSGVSYSDFRKRQLGFEEMARLDAARDELAALEAAPLVRPERGDRTVRMMTTEARQQGADILLVDQLSWVDAEYHYTGDRALTQKHGDLIADLKQDIASASSGKLPSFMAIQLNRQAVRNDNGGRGALENFANSDMIGQTVDIALGLWRNQDMRNSNLMGLDIMGSRRCDSKSWLLGWHLTSRSEIRIVEEYEEPA